MSGGLGGNDFLSGGDGDDIISASDGADFVQVGSGQDTLRGESGNDVLLGFGGDDKCFGGIGDDRLIVLSGREAGQLKRPGAIGRPDFRSHPMWSKLCSHLGTMREVLFGLALGGLLFLQGCTEKLESARTERELPPAVVAQRVAGTVRREASRLVRLETERETLLTTPEHPFAVPGSGWVSAGRLVPGNWVVSARFGALRLLSVRSEPVAGPVPVFNLSVASSHAYFVGTDRVLVHNTKCEAARRVAIERLTRELEAVNREIELLTQTAPSSPRLAELRRWRVTLLLRKARVGRTPNTVDRWVRGEKMKEFRAKLLDFRMRLRRTNFRQHHLLRATENMLAEGRDPRKVLGELKESRREFDRATQEAHALKVELAQLRARERPAKLESSSARLEQELREERAAIDVAMSALANEQARIQRTQAGSSSGPSWQERVSALQEEQAQLLAQWRAGLEERLDSAQTQLRLMRGIEQLRDEEIEAELGREIALLEGELRRSG